MPLPGTRVISDGWSDHHKPVSEWAMKGTCEITILSSGGVTQPDGSWIPSAQVLIYSGPFRMVRSGSSGENHPISGDRRLTTHTYEVQIKASAEEILTGDVLTATGGEPQVIGRRLRVESVRTATEEWSRNLSVVEFEEGR